MDVQLTPILNSNFLSWRWPERAVDGDMVNETVMRTTTLPPIIEPRRRLTPWSSTFGVLHFLDQMRDRNAYEQT